MALVANPRGIPQAPFVDNVAHFIADSDHEATLRKFQEMIAKYRFMESHLVARRASLNSKIPEIEKSLALASFVLSRSSSPDASVPFVAEFELAETLWASAKIPQTDKLNLWLGANVMLEYPVQEAHDLLSSKLTSAKTSFEQVTEDLEFIKEQITTVEVNMARVYNDDVRRRRSAGGSDSKQ